MNKFVITFALSTAMLSASAPALATSQSANTNHKVGICHATGSKTNPYVFISVDSHAVQAHERHQDGRDIINVSDASKCPKKVVEISTNPVGGGTLPGEAAPTMLPETGASSMLWIVISAIGGAMVAFRKRLFA